MKTRITCLVAVLCLMHSGAWSQASTNASPLESPLRLSPLLQQANQYPSVQALDQVIHQATIDQQLTQQEGLPQFDIQAQNSYGTHTGLSGASIPLPGSFNVSGTNSSNEPAINLQISGVAHWDLIQFGKLRNKIDAAALQTSSAEKQLEAGIWRYKYQLARDYIQLVFQQQMVKWAEASQHRQLRLRNMAAALAQAGLVAGADTLLSNAHYQQHVAFNNNWQGAVAASYSQVKKWVQGLPDSIPQLPTLLVKPIQDIHQFYNTTTEKHPLIQATAPAIQLASVQQEAVSKAVLPNISLLAAGQLRGFSAGASVLSQAYGLPARNYLAGIAVTWKLAPLYQKNYLEKRYVLQKNKLQAEREDTRLTINTKRSAARQQIIKASDQISAIEKSLDLARQAYRLYRVRYQSGLIDLTTLLQVEQTLQDAEKERLVAYYHYWTYLTSYAAAINDFSLLTRTFH